MGKRKKKHVQNEPGSKSTEIGKKKNEERNSLHTIDHNEKIPDAQNQHANTLTQNNVSDESNTTSSNEDPLGKYACQMIPVSADISQGRPVSVEQPTNQHGKHTVIGFPSNSPDVGMLRDSLGRYARQMIPASAEMPLLGPVASHGRPVSVLQPTNQHGKHAVIDFRLNNPGVRMFCDSLGRYACQMIPTSTEMPLLGPAVSHGRPVSVVQPTNQHGKHTVIDFPLNRPGVRMIFDPLGQYACQMNPVPAEMALLGPAVSQGRPVSVVQHGKHTVIDFPSDSTDVRMLHGKHKPSMNEINDHVSQIRNKICRESRVVLITDILQELCSFYQVSNICQLNPVERTLRKESDIPALFELTRIQGKVNAYIQAFVQFRNICTLHELEKELAKLYDKETFLDLKLGPLQKQLLVYELFKFPPSQGYIPSITTGNVFQMLWKFSRRKERITLQEFMEYLVSQYNVSSPFEIGVRIGSISLAIQVVRCAAYGDINHVKESTKMFFYQLCEEFDQYLSHVKRQIINGPKFPGDNDTLAEKIVGMPIIDGFKELFLMLQKMKFHVNLIAPQFEGFFPNALNTIWMLLLQIEADPLMSRVFHVLLATAPMKALGKDDGSILHFLGFSSAIEDLLKEGEKHFGKKTNTKCNAISPRAKLIEISKKWLTNCSEWNLPTLSRMEHRIVKEVDQSALCFNDLGHGPFLQFICSEKMLSEVVEFGATSSIASQQPINKEITMFIQSCDVMDGIQAALLLQFKMNINEKQLQKMVRTANSQGKYSSILWYLQAFLSGTEYHQNGSNGSNKMLMQAKKAIAGAPYLCNITEFTNWEYMFERQLGEIKDFIFSQFMDSSATFSFLEIRKNNIVKILRDCTTEMFIISLENLDAPMTSMCLVSIIGRCGHVTNAPIALLSNHMQNKFIKSSDTPQAIVNFALSCFLYIPFDLLCCLFNKVFVVPLSECFGHLTFKMVLLDGCTIGSKERSILHLLGFHLCIEEWSADYTQALHINHLRAINDYVKEDFPKVEETAQNNSNIKSNDEGMALMAKPYLLADEKPEYKDPIDACKLDVDDEQSKTESMEYDLTCNNKEPILSDASSSQSNIQSVDTESNEVEEDASGDLSTEVMTCDQNHCKAFIDLIRREQFGIGEVFGEKESKLINIHREREGRSLHRLSKELYTRDSHFVLELIQNADDNEYPEYLMKSENKEKPTVAFIIEHDSVTILNNEVGFAEKNIKALCDVGRSTKGIHRKGYIGQKGIGFKSVFRVTDCPEIHSKGYHIKFDASTGPNGLILPEWIDAEDDFQYHPSTTDKIQYSWSTKIILRLKKETQHSNLTSRFHDIHPSLLMFLNRLHTIIIDDKLSGVVKVMSKIKLNENILILSNNQEDSRWFTFTEEIPIQIREDRNTTAVSVAFPIQSKRTNATDEVLSPQPVFAFLPLRSYGFKFIIQADFEVPSSREDIDKDSPWNQCILQYLPRLIVKAFEFFKNKDQFPELTGVVQFFEFMDFEGQVLGIFKQVARQIMEGLRRELCLPAHSPDNDEKPIWLAPCNVVLSIREIRDVISPHILLTHLGLYFIHKDIQKRISAAVYKSLGVKALSLQQLVDIAKAIVLSKYLKSEELHNWIGNWLYAASAILKEDCDCSEKTMDMITSAKLYPLADGSFVSLKESVTFFPIDGVKGKKGKGVSKLIEKDLCILSSALLKNLDSVKRPQVVSFLRDLGVKSLSPHDLVNNYIIPLFKTGGWKEKSEDLVMACTIYLHEQLMRNRSLFDLEDIMPHIVLMTNKGFKNPTQEPIYLSWYFGNELQLETQLSDCDWTIISPRYSTAESDRMLWQEFFTELGLKKFVFLQRSQRKFHHSDLIGSVWENLSVEWEQTEDKTYIIDDLVCSEFDTLLQSQNEGQLVNFGLLLNKYWDERFKVHDLTRPKCLLKTSDGKPLGRTTYSSFFLKMKNAKWILDTSNQKTFVPRELFLSTHEATKLLWDKVNYISPGYSNRDFVITLGVQITLEQERFVKEFKKWCGEDIFETTYDHIMNVYKHISITNIALIDVKKFIFLPTECVTPPKSSVSGKFYPTTEVCWDDPSGIMSKSQSLSQRRVLRVFYPNDMKEFFVGRLNVQPYPDIAEYLNVISGIACRTTLPDNEACEQILTLFSGLSCQLIHSGDTRSVEEDWSLTKSTEDKRLLYEELKEFIDPTAVVKIPVDVKIFPVTTNEFVSRGEKPIIVFDEKLADIYETGGAPLIFLKHLYRLLRKDNQNSSKRNLEKVVEKKISRILIFFQACGLPLLKDIIESPEVVPELPVKGFPKWHRTLHELTPYIQRYIFIKQPSYYAKLQKQDFASYLKDSLLFEVKKLEVIYRLSDRNTVNVKLPKHCSIQDMEGKAYIYIHTSSKDNRDNDDQVVIDLMELFVQRSEGWHDQFCDFVLSLIFTSKKNEYLRRISIPILPQDHQVWAYPKLEDVILTPPKPVVVEEQPLTDNKSKGEIGMTCWPPRSLGSSGIKCKPESVKKEEQDILDQWKPPEAPAENQIQHVPFTVESRSKFKPQSVKKDEQKILDQWKPEAPTANLIQPLPLMVESNNGKKDSTLAQDVNNEQEVNLIPDASRAKVNSLDSSSQLRSQEEALGTRSSSSKLDIEVKEDLTRNDDVKIINRNRNQPCVMKNIGTGGTTGPMKNEESVSVAESSSHPAKHQNIKFDPGQFQHHDLMERYEDVHISINWKESEMVHLLHRITAKEPVAENPVGYFGEQIVYRHLCEVYRNEITSGDIRLIWLNKDKEKGDPYDIEICFGNSSKEKSIFVEVKSTYKDESKEFEISSQQLRFAFKKGPRFHLYRLSGLANVQQMKLRRLKNLSQHMDVKTVRLYMIL